MALNNVFEQAQWNDTHKAIKERIAIYDKSLSEVVAEIYQQIHPHQQDDSFWIGLKQHYVDILNQHPQYELAETFYNSVIGRIFRHDKISDDFMFILPSRCFVAGQDREKVIFSFDTTGTVRNMMEEIFATYRFNIPFENREADMQSLDDALRARLNREQLASVHTVELLRPIFLPKQSRLSDRQDLHAR